MNAEKKTCRICGMVKNITEMEIDSRKKSIYMNRCRECKHSNDDKAARSYRSLKRRAKAANVPMEVTAREIRLLFNMFDGACAYCNKRPESSRHLHLEHICAMSEGGRNTLANLIPACATCNISKKSKPIVSFFFDNREKFPDSNFVTVVDYMALLGGEKKEDVVKKIADDHALYQLRQLQTELEREAT
jgi:5-methylcytosine-specific restriction endonuclease McrA